MSRSKKIDYLSHCLLDDGIFSFIVAFYRRFLELCAASVQKILQSDRGTDMYRKQSEIWLLLLSAVFFLAIAMPVAAAMAQRDISSSSQANALSLAAKERLDKELEDMVGDTGRQVPGLAVIILKDGKEVYCKYAGSRYLDVQHPEKNRPVTKNTRFRVASVSKQYTIFALMQLVEQGKVALDDDASAYLGFELRNPNYPDKPITVRMLAAHTSSLRDGDSYRISPERALEQFFIPRGAYYANGIHFAPIGQEPGKYFAYCNLNYGVLGTIIEKVTGERFDLYLKRHVLQQLDTKADFVVSNLAAKEFANLGAIYRKNRVDGTWPEQGAWRATLDDYHGQQPASDTIDFAGRTYGLKDYQLGTNATIFGPHGDLRITAEELSHGLQMLMEYGRYRGKQILRTESVEEILKKQWSYDGHNGDTAGGTFLSYGLGEYLIGGPSHVCKNRDIELCGHTGEAWGLSAGVFFRPGTKDGFVYIMNGEGLEKNVDVRSAGRFSSNNIWEESIMDAICRAMAGDAAISLSADLK